jgi:putative ABC transport system ATP-binding protein
MSAPLKAVAVGVDLDGRPVFDGISLAAEAGTLTAITGPSGSGKTTLARVLSGLRVPDRGEVLFQGLPSAELRDGPPAALVAQDEGLLAVLTTTETVTLPLQMRCLAKPEIRARARHWLGAVGLEACADRLVDELSGGQRRRLAIARALALQAPIVIMDEPTAGLDADNRRLIVGLLLDELRRGAALVLVSHDPDVLVHSTATFELAGRV